MLETLLILYYWKVSDTDLKLLKRRIRIQYTVNRFRDTLLIAVTINLTNDPPSYYKTTIFLTY
jgi:hypothetical protein